MAAIPRDRILNLQVFMDITGNKVSCLFHYAADAALAIEDPLNFELQWEANVLPTLQGCVVEDCTFDAIYCWADAPGICKPRMAPLNGKTGSIVEEALPENLSAIIRFDQYEVSSKHNGRIYLPGIGEGSAVDGLLSATFVSTILGPLALTLMTPLTNGSSTNFNLCNVVRRSGGVPITPVGYVVHAVIPTRSMGTQRRRTTEKLNYSA